MYRLEAGLYQSRITDRRKAQLHLFLAVSSDLDADRFGIAVF